MEALLAAVTRAVFTQLAARLAGLLLDEKRALRWLGRDAPRLAFKSALAAALADLREQHPEVADQFFDEAFLAGDAAAGLLSRCVPPGEPPADRSLAEACAAQLGAGPGHDQRVVELMPAAAFFLERLREHLRVQEVFRPLFDSASADAAAVALARIAEQLDALPQILERVERPRQQLKRYIIPSARRVRLWTEGFVGRDFIFAALDDRLLDPAFASGYVLVRGEPGIGKTAIAAELIRSRNYTHHFNIATGNVRTAREFLANVCAQLVERYSLPYEELPPHAEVGSELLVALLDEAVAVAQHEADTPVVLVVDALDEAETTAPDSGVNRLALPYDLPEGAYVIATIRSGVDPAIDVAAQTSDVVLSETDANNRGDIETYIDEFLARRAAEMDGRLREWGIGRAAFVDTVAASSEGNFMYLVHVLPDIADGRIRPSDLEGRLENLPGGLERYYERHWRAMQDRDRDAFRRRQKPVICMLASAREAVPAAKVAEWINGSGAFDRIDIEDVEDVFDEWRQFLNPEPGDPPRYRLYHASFLDFLERKVGLNEYRRAAGAAVAAKIDW